MHLSHAQQLSGRVLPARQARSVRARTATLEPPSTATVTPVSGWDYLSPEAKERASDKKANKFEKVKVAKCGSAMWTEVHELAAHLRDGSKTWEELNLDDVDVRLKFAGMFHRGKRTPQRFMMRLKLPNGDVTSKQLRYLASVLRPYGDDGCGDITTRNNLQLRGVRLEDADKIVEGLMEHGMSSFQSGMDSVRNLTGSPIAGLDPHELLDVRPLLYKLNDVLFNKGRGNPEFANLPRKFNICISPSRDDFPHTQINDLGFEAVKDAETGKIWFNVVVGGLFSIKRNMMSIPLGCAVTEEQLIPFCLALLRVFRDHGLRGGDRQKTRLIWTIEELGGVEPFRALVAKQMGVDGFRAPLPTPHELGEPHWERRELLGVHAQKQEGLHWVGASVPSGRITADDMDDFASIADKYGDGSIRLTCEENVLFPNIPTAKLEKMLAEPLFERFTTQPGPLERGMVSCTGSQFCGFGLVETKNKAMRVVAALEAQLNIPKTVRMHWTGCPNSCGQAQVADIGLMGAPARLDGKAVEGVKIFLGGKIGENPALADLLQAGVPADEEHLLPVLKDLLIKEFGATPLAA